jgi:hypothetical protein
MLNKSLFTALATLATVGAVASPVFASGGGGTGGGGAAGGGGTGGGGGGTPKPVLATPSIDPGTFDGIGSGPVYVHESFGFAQGTRYNQSGAIVDANRAETINGMRAEYPNNKTETWSTTTPDVPTWKLVSVGPADPLEPFTGLQQAPPDSSLGYQDGELMIVGDPPGGVSTRPSALLPFVAPATSASTVSGDVVPFNGKTAIGFSSSSATTKNFESNGQAWLEVDDTGDFATGGNTNVLRWTFHTGGLSGTTLSGTYRYPFDTANFTPVAVSYDPVNHVAAATIDGAEVASVPYNASSIKFVGVEGSYVANVDNFTVRTGTVNDPPPAAVAPPTK